MRTAKTLVGFCLLAFGLALAVFHVSGEARAGGGGPPSVVILRCQALAEPTFTYQVVALAHTEDVELDIQASTVDGEGDNCAVAISQILEATGMDAKDVRLEAGEDYLVATFIE